MEQVPLDDNIVNHFLEASSFRTHSMDELIVKARKSWA